MLLSPQSHFPFPYSCCCYYYYYIKEEEEEDLL